jgi:hypothetical protein
MLSVVQLRQVELALEVEEGLCEYDPVSVQRELLDILEL